MSVLHTSWVTFQRPAPAITRPPSGFPTATPGPAQGVRFSSSLIQREKIPVIDISRYATGSPAVKRRIAKALGEGLKAYGFVAVKGHGVPKALFEQNYRRMQQVFQLDETVKRRYHHPEIGSQRGYLPLKAELKDHALNHGAEKPKTRPDLKESWHIGTGLNVFPREVPGYEQDAMRLFREMEKVGILLVDAIGLYLGDNKGYLNSLVVDPKGKPIGNHLMRAIHYPSVRPEDLEALPPGQPYIRGGEHGDLNLITLLPEATNSGLEIKRRDGSWLPVHAQEGHIIVNAGDMLALITANTKTPIPSTRHRVVGDRDKMKESRYAIPMFIHPNHDKPFINLATGKPVVYTLPNGQKVTCRDVGEFVYLQLRKHGAGTQKQELSYEAFKVNNRRFVERNGSGRLNP